MTTHTCTISNKSDNCSCGDTCTSVSCDCTFEFVITIDESENIYLDDTEVEMLCIGDTLTSLLEDFIDFHTPLDSENVLIREI